MTGRQQNMREYMRMFWYSEHSQPDNVMPMADSAPRGNWNRILSSVEYPNVDTIRGPKPVTAPLTVYLFKIQSFSLSLSRDWECYKGEGQLTQPPL